MRYDPFFDTNEDGKLDSFEQFVQQDTIYGSGNDDDPKED